MKNILILVNRKKNISDVTICSLTTRIQNAGCKYFLCDKIDKKNDLEQVDLIVVLGGDGTIIEAAKATAGFNIPIFGINYGKIGYLADAESVEESYIEDVLNGNCKVEKRMTLDVAVIRSGRVVHGEFNALNDVVLSNGPVPHLLSFELHCNGFLSQNIRSDGLILATPTGSSAYSMSAGGPVVDPEMQCIIGTPICPHSLHVRPVVFKGSSVIEIRNATCRTNKIYLTVDGKETVEIDDGDIIRIAKSDRVVPLVRIKEQGFLNVLFTKLSDKDS